MTPRVLSIAGLDPSGGAGLLADVMAIRSCGGRPSAVCAALTAQGDGGVRGVMPIPGPFIESQVAALGGTDAVKIGMLASAEAVVVVVTMVEAGALPGPVLNPLLRSSSGHALIDDQGAVLLRDQLLPRCRAVTPNLAEAAWLTGQTVETAGQMEDAARALVDAGVRLAVVTGGHLQGALVDVCFQPGMSSPVRLPRERVAGSARGTGCRFSAALATWLVQVEDEIEATRRAGDLVADHVRQMNS